MQFPVARFVNVARTFAFHSTIWKKFFFDCFFLEFIIGFKPIFQRCRGLNFGNFSSVPTADHCCKQITWTCVPNLNKLRLECLQSFLLSLQLFTSHVVFDSFIFQEHKILYNRGKFPYDITVGITFRTDKKTPVKFLEIAFKKNKQKHYPLIISRNLHILMKCSFYWYLYYYYI